MTGKPVHWYRQSGVVPVRRSGKETEVLLVTSIGGKRWIIPKGIVEPKMSAAESALQEAWEEAGVRGSLRTPAAGHYNYPKWAGICSVEVFVLDVEKLHDNWPEERERKREWFSPKDAASKVREEELRAIILRVSAA